MKYVGLWLLPMAVSAHVNLEAEPNFDATIRENDAVAPEYQLAVLNKLAVVADDTSPGPATIIAAVAPGAAIKQTDNTPGNPKIDPPNSSNATQSNNSTVNDSNSDASGDGGFSTATPPARNGTAAGGSTAILTGAANKTSVGPELPTTNIKSSSRAFKAASTTVTSTRSSSSSGAAATGATIPLGMLGLAAIRIIL